MPQGRPKGSKNKPKTPPPEPVAGGAPATSGSIPVSDLQAQADAVDVQESPEKALSQLEAEYAGDELDYEAMTETLDDPTVGEVVEVSSAKADDESSETEAAGETKTETTTEA